MTVILSTLGVAALLFFGIVSAVTLNFILRLRFVPPRFELLRPLEVPEAERPQLAPGLAQLDALGFAHPVALRQMHQLVAGQPLRQHGLVLQHRAVAAAAYVVQIPQPDRGRRWSLFFVSRTKAGHTLVTRNRASTGGPLPQPEITTQDCWLPDWPSVWQAHQRRMRALQPDAAQWCWLSARAWAEAGAASEAATFQARVARGELVDDGAGHWRISLRPALLTLARVWGTAVASSRGMVGDAPVLADGGGHTVQQLVDNFERDAAARHGSKWSQRAKWLLFFATAAAAAASFGLSMDLGTVPALVAVLLFHELGHYAAMRWAGYRDLKVFFLPFLGAAVSGRHEHPTAKQELVVLFAGPVPGLLLGLAALAWLPAGLPLAGLAGFWHNLALLAVTINAFNLLPIHPLDGGKIFEILLLGRWPWVAFAGRALGVVALAGLAMTMDNPIGSGVLWGLVLLMGLGLTHQRHEARLASALRAQGVFGGLARGDALRALFSALQRLGLGAKPWGDQRLLAEALLPVMTRPRLARGARAGGLLVYGFFLFLPLLALVGGVWFAARAPLAVAASASASASAPVPAAVDPERDRREVNQVFAQLLARVQAEPDTGRRWALLVGELGELTEMAASQASGALPAAQALLRQAETLAAAQPDAISAQAQVALWQAQATPDGAERRQQLLALVARYDEPATAPRDAAPLARAALDWLYEARQAEPAQRARVIDRALAVASPAPLQAPLREFKVEQLLAQGDGDAALRRRRPGWKPR
jgi:Zn-dependent protease